MNNTIKTVFLMTLLTILVLLVGSLIGGDRGMFIAFAFSVVMNFGSYWFSDRLVLMMYRARAVSQAEAPRLYGIVSRIAVAAQIPMPKVFIIPGDSPNAFATGRNPEHAAVAATEGILDLMSEDELEGVIAHEFAHIKHRDILTSSIVATLVGVITMIARIAGWSMMVAGGRDDRKNSNGFAELALLILAPVAAILVQLAISRSREFAADAGGARITGRPLSLANALQKLERASEQLPMENASPATAHLFIVNPLHGGGMMKLFATHPPIAERIERLHQIAMGAA